MLVVGVVVVVIFTIEVQSDWGDDPDCQEEIAGDNQTERDQDS